MAPGLGWGNLATLGIAVFLAGCGTKLDAQDYPISATYDRWAVDGDRVSVVVSAGGVDENVRAVTQYQGQAPRISVELANDTLTIDSNCAERPTCSVELFAELDAAADGQMVSDLGSLQIGTDLTGSMTAELGDGSITGTDVSIDSLQANLEVGSVDVSWVVRPLSVDVDTLDGDVTIEVPAGSYRLDVPEGATIDGVTDDVGADASIRIAATGSVVVRGN